MQFISSPSFLRLERNGICPTRHLISLEYPSRHSQTERPVPNATQIDFDYQRALRIQEAWFLKHPGESVEDPGKPP